MCIVIGKYFEEHGWVAIKNRDRNYIPEISFKKKIQDGVEILYFWDDITQYCEGFNSAGVGILSASLMVLDDEKEITTRKKVPSKDGGKIKRALQYPNVKAVAMSLIKQKLPGNTLVFDQDTMILIEGAWTPGGYADGDYQYKIKELAKNEYVVRTNHGIMLDWAGYQRDPEDEGQTMSRISSECRRLIAAKVTEAATTPEEILDNLTKDYTGDGQLNALRTTTEKKKMRTTSQIMIVPKEKTMYVRPVQSHMSFNFWELNHPKQQTWVELLSNRVLYLNTKDMAGEPPFVNRLDHNSD